MRVCSKTMRVTTVPVDVIPVSFRSISQLVQQLPGGLDLGGVVGRNSASVEGRVKLLALDSPLRTVRHERQCPASAARISQASRS